MDPAALDFGSLNWLGFALALVANVVLGFVWYAAWSPTGRVWMRETKTDPNQRPPGAQMATSMVLMLVGAALMMFVLAHTMKAYTDAFSNTAAAGVAGYELSVADGLTGGFFLWLGFVVPVGLNRVAFERGSWPLFAVNAGYSLVSMLVAGALIATVGA